METIKTKLFNIKEINENDYIIEKFVNGVYEDLPLHYLTLKEAQTEYQDLIQENGEYIQFIP